MMGFLSQLWINTKTILFALFALLQAPEIKAYDLSKLTLKPGFEIKIFAQVAGARTLKWGPKGTLFVSTRGLGKVYALVDKDRDFKVDKIYTLAQGLNSPNGLDILDGDLYVADVDKLLKFKDVESNLKNNLSYEVVYDKFPSNSHHGWRYIAFGKDKKLYMSVGAPCNACVKKNPIFASLIQFDLETKSYKIIAHGVRNSVGFDFHPVTGDLWFTDNGRDFLGDDSPPCELNRLKLPLSSQKNKKHYGFPVCHGKNTPDPTNFKNSKLSTQEKKKVCETKYIKPEAEFQAHIAPLGVVFYTHKKFPKKYHHGLFIAEHGSWNRSTKVGYKISFLQIKNNKVISYDPFIQGFLQSENDVLGRPVDLVEDREGGLLISDDYAGLIYHVTYKNKASNSSRTK